jgi:hypothetical protein
MRKLQLEWQGYYPMDEKTIRSKVDDRAGVFKLSRKQSDGSLKPFYIAQAESLKMRLLEIITSTVKSSIKEQLDKGDCHFRFTCLLTKEDLDAAEKALYKRYTPKCNDKDAVPQAEDVEVNYN